MSYRTRKYQPAMGLALASGGARGAYQAGALLRLAEAGYRYNHIVGTSIGTLNGAFYVQGDGSVGHMQSLCERWRSVGEMGVIRPDVANLTKFFLHGVGVPFGSWILAMTDPEWSVLDTKPIEALLDSWLDYDRICGAPNTLLVGTQKARPGRRMGEGGVQYFQAAAVGPRALRECILASAAIPFVFKARRLPADGQYHQDAGWVEPIGTRELYARGVSRMTAIYLDVSEAESPADYPLVKFHQVRPSKDIKGFHDGIPSTLDFRTERIEALIHLGYRDAEMSLRSAA